MIFTISTCTNQGDPPYPGRSNPHSWDPHPSLQHPGKPPGVHSPSGDTPSLYLPYSTSSAIESSSLGAFILSWGKSVLLTSAGAELLSWNVPHPYRDTTCRSLARTSLVHFQALSHHSQFSMKPKYVCALSFNITAH